MGKRAYARVESFHAVHYSKGFCSGHNVASTVDFSLGGAKIRTPCSLKKGEGLEIEVGFTADSLVIKGRGRLNTF